MEKKFKKKVRMFLWLMVPLLVGLSVACESKKMASDQQAAREYTYAQKEEFSKKIQSDLADINKDLKDLEIKAQKADKKAKIEVERKMQDLRLKSKELNNQIDKIKSATDSDWDKVKSECNKVFEEFKNSVRQARMWLSEKLAP